MEEEPPEHRPPLLIHVSAELLLTVGAMGAYFAELLTEHVASTSGQLLWSQATFWETIGVCLTSILAIVALWRLRAAAALWKQQVAQLFVAALITFLLFYAR